MGRYRREMSRIAQAYLGCSEDAEDAVQESVTRALVNMDSLARPEVVGCWLQGIADNVCRETIRQRARLVFGSAIEDSQPTGWHAAIEQCQDGRGRTARQALAALPLEQRALLVLYCFEDASLEEIASLFDTSPGAIKMRIMRARAAAREAAERRLPDCRETRAAIADAYHHLASLCYARGQYARLARFWSRALARAPHTVEKMHQVLRPGIYVLTANTWSAYASESCPTASPGPLPDNVIGAALQALEAASRRYADDPGVWLVRGNMLLFAAASADAGVSALERAAASPRLRREALLRAATGLAVLGQPDRALAYLERTERDHLWDEEMPLVCALAFLTAGQHHQALRKARRALLFAEGTPQPYWRAHRFFVPARILAMLGRREEARQAYIHALRADPPTVMRAAVEADLVRLAG